MGECKLLASAAGVFAQLALLFCAFGVLVVKRQLELRRGETRSWGVWGLDVSKQGFSSGAAHGCGMLWAIAIERAASAHSSTVSQCAWYLVVFIVDTSLGVVVAVGLHKQAVKWVRSWPEERQRTWWLGSIAHCGEYGKNKECCGPGGMLSVWAPQMVEWVFCTLIGRLVSGGTTLLLWRQLRSIAGGVDSMFDGYPDAELAFVMVAGPLLLNLLQAWVQDQYLKFRRGQQAVRGSDCEDADSMPGGPAGAINGRDEDSGLLSGQGSGLGRTGSSDQRRTSPRT